MSERFVVLHCDDCHISTDCPIASRKLYSGSAGCARLVSEEDYASWFHYTNEVLPFIKIRTTPQYVTRVLDEFDELARFLYRCPRKDEEECATKI